METKENKNNFYNWANRNRDELFFAEKIRGTLFSLFIPLILYAPSNIKKPTIKYDIAKADTSLLYKQINESTAKNYIVRDATLMNNIPKEKLNLIDKLRD